MEVIHQLSGLSLRLLCLAILFTRFTSQSNACQTGQVRLAGGSSFLEGRVEYCVNGQWGTVCDDDFDAAEAALTCKQLGFSAAGAQAHSEAHFGPGQGPIFLQRLECSGSESGLAECSSTIDCIHSEDAGVTCQNNGDNTMGNGAALYYKGRQISNNTLISTEFLQDLDPLYCVTSQPSCCNTSSTGNWYPPSGDTPLPSSGGSQLPPLYQTRGDDQSVRLQTANASVSITSGLYSCVIPDSNNDNRTLYVGIYSSPSEGSINTVSLTYDEASSTLTCTSTGGPATTVTWTKNGDPVEVDGTTYQQAQVVLNRVTATYKNTLIVKKRESQYSGDYKCSVGNSVGSMVSQESVKVSVCMDGEVRVLDNGPMRQLELCSENSWFHVESTLTVRSDENVVTNLIAKTTVSGIELEWNADDSQISNYDVSCSNNMNTFMLHLNANARTATFDSLPSSSDYQCCVTANLNRNLANMAAYFDRTCLQAASTGGLTLKSIGGSQNSYLTYSLIGLIVILIVCVVSVALGCVCVLISKRNYQKTHPRRGPIDINTTSSFLVDNPIYKTTGSVASLDSENGLLANGNDLSSSGKHFTPRKMESSHSAVPQPNGHVPAESKLALASNPQYGTVEQQYPDQQLPRYIKVASDCEPAYELLPETHHSNNKPRVSVMGSNPDPIYSMPTALNRHPSHHGPKPEYKLPVYESTTDIPATSGKDGEYSKLNHHNT